MGKGKDGKMLGPFQISDISVIPWNAPPHIISENDLTERRAFGFFLRFVFYSGAYSFFSQGGGGNSSNWPRSFPSRGQGERRLLSFFLLFVSYFGTYKAISSDGRRDSGNENCVQFLFPLQ